MTLRLFPLLLFTLLGTCGRAQSDVSLAFIKGGTGFLIDSVTVRTSLDQEPYGFAFPTDTLLLDVSIFAPVDQITLETFARGTSFGLAACWVDGPTANVHLSVDAGRNLIDSVGLSPVHRWFVDRLRAVNVLAKPAMRQQLLISATEDSFSNLMSASFGEYFLRQPYANRIGAEWLYNIFADQPPSLKRHPQVKAVRERLKFLSGGERLNPRPYAFADPAGTPATLRLPKADLILLNFYGTDTDLVRAEHTAIEQLVTTDSLFQKVPVIGVSLDPSDALWKLYQREEKFSWRHYREVPRRGLFFHDKVPLYPTGATYVLVNGQGVPLAIFPSLRMAVAAVALRLKRQ
ncbi:MAG: hypothetical protein AAFZ52_03540 [Bacteroidota bacterium]